MALITPEIASRISQLPDAGQRAGIAEDLLPRGERHLEMAGRTRGLRRMYHEAAAEGVLTTIHQALGMTSEEIAAQGPKPDARLTSGPRGRRARVAAVAR